MNMMKILSGVAFTRQSDRMHRILTKKSLLEKEKTTLPTKDFFCSKCKNLKGTPRTGKRLKSSLIWSSYMELLGPSKKKRPRL
jgi:hypothetical protein